MRVASLLLVASLLFTGCAADDRDAAAPPRDDDLTEGGPGERAKAGSASQADDEKPAAAGDAPASAPLDPSDPLLRFAPRLRLHPDDRNRPSSVDWYLSRVTLRFQHDNCPDHEVLGLGKVTQASLVAQRHPANKSLCRHDDAKIESSTASEEFFLQAADSATYAGAPRSEWRTYAARRMLDSAKERIDYYAFYPYNDNFSNFNHEGDWEHVSVIYDPSVKDPMPIQVLFSFHGHETVIGAGDAKLEMDGTHPVSYVAKGTHANYPKPGDYPIAAPKNGQIFIGYWGKWGEIGELAFTTGPTRHFP